MNNYPPGVTGTEYAIAGPDWTGTINVDCEHENLEGNPCSFSGDVDAESYHGTRTWICPQCNYEHENYFTPEDERDDHFDDDPIN